MKAKTFLLRVILSPMKTLLVAAVLVVSIFGQFTSAVLKKHRRKVQNREKVDRWTVNPNRTEQGMGSVFRAQP